MSLYVLSNWMSRKSTMQQYFVYYQFSQQPGEDSRFNLYSYPVNTFSLQDLHYLNQNYFNMSNIHFVIINRQLLGSILLLTMLQNILHFFNSWEFSAPLIKVSAELH